MIKKILVLGSYGRGNAGDDALLLAILHLLKGHEVAMNCAHEDLLPADDLVQRTEKISTTSNADWKRKLRVFFSTDLLIYGGGDLWVELYGDRYPRSSLWKMLLVNLVCRFFGKKVLYLGCGAGDLKGFSLVLARCSAYLAHDIVLREKRSAERLKLIDKAKILSDLTAVLADDAVISEAKLGPTRKIGISLLYHLPNPEENYSRLTHELVSLINKFSRYPYHFEFILIPLYQSNGRDNKDDVCCALDIQQSASSAVQIARTTSIRQLQNTLAECDVVIGTRLHASILSVLSETPVIGISYRPKVRSFFESAGLEKYVVDLNEIEQISDRLMEVIADYRNVRIRVKGSRKDLMKSGEEYAAAIQKYL